MIPQVRQFFALAGLTAVEATRQPICLLLTVSCLIMAGLMPLILLHQFGEDGRLVRDSLLAIHFIVGLLVAGYASCSSLSREMKSGTAAAVLSKSVGREMFFIAKFAGIAAVICAFSTCATFGTLLADRVTERFVEAAGHVGWVTDTQTAWILLAAPFVALLIGGAVNYFGRRPFESSAFTFLVVTLLVAAVVCGFFDRTGRLADFDLRFELRILPVSILITMALVVLAAMALTLSVRLATVPTLVMLVVILLAGLMSDNVFGRIAAESAPARVLYRLVPNWRHFWMPEALANDGVIPWDYVLDAGVYGLLYTAGVLLIGVLIFRHSEMR